MRRGSQYVLEVAQSHPAPAPWVISVQAAGRILVLEHLDCNPFEEGSAEGYLDGHYFTWWVESASSYLLEKLIQALDAAGYRYAYNTKRDQNYDVVLERLTQMKQEHDAGGFKDL